MRKCLGALAGLGLLAALPAQAATFQGVNYVLTGAYTNAEHSEASFLLTISGINGAGDLEGGRFGVESFAWALPQGFSTATAPGYTLELGGLNSSGCNGSGNFFCFNKDVDPTAPPLPADSQLQLAFTISLLSGFTLDDYDSHFKVFWLGLKNNYDLISQSLSVTNGITPFVTAVPIPPAVLLFASGLAGLGALSWRRRKRQQAAETA